MLRISGGLHRGRRLKTPPTLKTRPSQGRLREALFSSIQMQIPESNVLDLFAGAGTLGLEALSRGAKHTTFVENNRQAVAMIRENLASLDLSPQSKIFQTDVSRTLEQLTRQKTSFDVVLADPPYQDGWELKLIENPCWETLLHPEGSLVLEWGPLKAKLDSLPDETPFLVKVREKTYGDSRLSTYQLRA